jgi:hypothetical protein
MSDCDRHQETLSALLDGEASPEETLPAFDHLLGCSACRDFYARARALEGALALSGDQGEGLEERAPAGVWERIAGRVAPQPERPSTRMAWTPPHWARRLAAALLLGVAVWGGYALGGRQGRPAAGGDVEVLVGGGGMTDARFLELTLEVLRSDPRYHEKMREVLTALDDRPRERSGQEGAVVAGEGEGARAMDRREPGFTTANL